MSIANIFSFSSILIMLVSMLYIFFLNRRRKSISYDIKYGHRCYICKESIEKERNLSDWLDDKEKIVACVSCERDRKLNEVIGGKRYVIFNRVKKYLISDNSKKIWIWFIILQVCAISLSIFSLFIFKLKFNVGIITNLFNMIYWAILVIKTRLTTIKKPSTK